MKKLVGLVSVCCVLGLVAAPALSKTLALVPKGSNPAGGPYKITAGAGEKISLDVYVSDSQGLPVETFQSTMPCSASGGSGGSIDFQSRSLDEDHPDYIFLGLETLGMGGFDGVCPSNELVDQPFLASMVLGVMPVIVDWAYMGQWEYLVSSDAEGTFTLDLICAHSPPQGNCPAPLTFIKGDGGPYPPSAVHGVTINIGAVPTVSEWGLFVMAVLVVAAGTLVCGRRRAAQA